MPNPVDGLLTLRPCPKCGGKPKTVFELLNAQAIGVISCTACGHATRRRVWIDAKRLWNGTGQDADATLVD